MKLTPRLKAWLVEHHPGVTTQCSEEQFKKAALTAIEEGRLPVTTLADLTREGPAPADVFKSSGNVRVKDASEAYSTVKHVGKHAKTGLPVLNEQGQHIETPSQLEYAKAGAYLKFLANRAGVSAPLNEHERSLLDECFEKDAWCGQLGNEYVASLSGQRVKTLISDNTSGGLELNPVWFDEMVVQFPLLNGELFPFIDLKDMPRGVNVQAASVGNPTVAWGTAEGTAMSEFDTDSIVGDLNTSVFPVSCALEFGRDLMSDSPVNIGQTLAENIGQRMLAELDGVIVLGDGTTQPQGLANASAIASVVSVNGAGGPPTVSDYESLMFAVGKQYRNPAMRCAFIGNDLSYRRARGIAVSPSDQRRVFGMDEQSYQMLEHPYHVQNDIPNSTVFFGALSRYRLYRRMGQEVRFVTEGKQLALNNTVLLVVRGRYGGRGIDANAFAKMTTAQS
ncbi:MAG: phage major capsid protein [Planctomycetes bacterium]|nr:phage major capsid protein [Planctomycetota bacterium]